MNKHAFLVIAHQEAKVLEKLLLLLDDERNDIYLHIDKRNQNLYELFKDYSLQKSNLYVLEKRYIPYWGSLNQIKTELLLFATASENHCYQYYHLLSGVDMPLKTMEELHCFINHYKGLEFITYWNTSLQNTDLYRKTARYYLFNNWKKKQKGVLRSFLVILRNIVIALQKNLKIERSFKLPSLHKGSSWVSLSHDAVRYLVERKEVILKRYAYMYCADEIYKQTELYHSPFYEKVFEGGATAMASLRNIDWERGGPYVWQEKDFEELIHSPYFFARKMTDGALVERLFDFLQKRKNQLEDVI